jgi:hypothetical protein
MAQEFDAEAFKETTRQQWQNAAAASCARSMVTPDSRLRLS